ncbi:SNF2 family N-terminal domain-containing protein [Parasitella parasitica]|nr:SNF2 family N-terminal domain-containing protein [Parasitella parasitica]
MPLYKNAKQKLLPKPKTAIDQQTNDLISQRLSRMETLQQDHDRSVKELYHLELFQNMLEYKPNAFINDVRYNKYVEDFDMWRSIKSKEPFASSLQDPKLIDLLQSAIYESMHTIPHAHAHSSAQINPAINSSTSSLAMAPIVNTISTGTGLRRQNRQFVTLDDYINSFVSIDENEDITPEACELLVEKERVIRQKIDALKRRGGYSTPYLKEIASKRPQQQNAHKHDPPLHHENLLSDMVVVSKNFLLNQKYKRAAARRCAKAVERYWENIRTHDERRKREESKRIVRLAKWTSQQVKKKWKVVERVCEARLKEVLKEQQAQEGRRHLELILEHSEQMLNVRNEELRQQQQKAAQTATQTAEPAQNDDDLWQDEEAYGQDDIRDHMIEDHQDESDDDEAALKALEDDQNMTVEELMAKYHSIKEQEETDTETDATQLDEENDFGSDMSSSVAATDDAEFSNVSDGQDIPIEDDGQSEDDDEELDALNDDANLTVEQLIQKYNYSIGNDADDEEDSQAEESTKRRSDSDNMSINNDDAGQHIAKRRKLSSASIQEESTLAELNDKVASGDEDEGSNYMSQSMASTAATSNDNSSSSKFNTRIPFLLRGTLREYQHVGLDWLASLYNNGLNGILADEMGLGKTIQTIALLAHLACEKQVWGPHLVVVPTSVILNWEMEFKKWLPGFKIMTYYGSPKQRKEKRIGWSKDNAFHVCITSYQLVLQDQNMFRRKAWQYLILDEAHHIKNFRSQRWQVLLNFNSKRRLLLTGTPLQNNLMELWSLLYFLMPNGVSQDMPIGFANLKEFQEWFSHPVDRMIENNTQQQAGMDEESRAAIQKLHTVLRPYLLRRLKADVEKQMPEKHEHIVYCRLSKRQRYLYDDFMSRGKTRETLASGNFLSIINCLMQLRKVCNHPDLFEERPILTSFAMDDQVQFNGQCLETLVRRHMSKQTRDKVNLGFLNLILTDASQNKILSQTVANDTLRLEATKDIMNEIANHQKRISVAESRAVTSTSHYQDLKKYAKYREMQMHIHAAGRWQMIHYVNHFRCAQRPLYDANLIALLSPGTKYMFSHDPKQYLDQCEAVYRAVSSYRGRISSNLHVLEQFGFVTPKVVLNADRKTTQPQVENDQMQLLRSATSVQNDIFHPIESRLSIAFPDKRLLQYDCGKLQKLDQLLRTLAAGGHRALIFTQMTRVLDVLETFLNMHGYRYLRLDGATKVEQRQVMTEHFNNDRRITCFILSTRSGGLGINLTGADTVIFYDSDWNPSMDKQCQDRAHRIGQTRDVHIYRFVTEFTIEENIFKKANQKRMLDNVIIQEGDFTDDYFNKNEWWKDLPEVVGSGSATASHDHSEKPIDYEQALLQAEDESDAAAAIAARKELNMDENEFDENRQVLSETASGPASPFTPTMSSTPTRQVSVGPDADVEDEHGDVMVEKDVVLEEKHSQPQPQPQPQSDQEQDEQDDEEQGQYDEDMQLNVGHVDQYMLQFWEREVVGTDLGFGGFPDE